MTRKPIVAANWKMNLRLGEAEQLVRTIADGLRELDALPVEVVLCVPFPYIGFVVRWLRELGVADWVQVGAQNCHWEVSGAWTGEVSPYMLRDTGCTWVIIGHSERRRPPFEETDELLARKVANALSAGLNVIFCVGETEDEYRRAHSQHIVRRQLITGLFTREAEVWRRIVVAYEPVWAIGTGKTASPEYAQAMHALIRKEVHRRYGEEVAQLVRILYGGSIQPENAHALFEQSDIDGGLVGSASLRASSFLEIVRAMVEVAGGAAG